MHNLTLLESILCVILALAALIASYAYLSAWLVSSVTATAEAIR